MTKFLFAIALSIAAFVASVDRATAETITFDTAGTFYQPYNVYTEDGFRFESRLGLMGVFNGTGFIKDPDPSPTSGVLSAFGVFDLTYGNTPQAFSFSGLQFSGPLLLANLHFADGSSTLLSFTSFKLGMTSVVFSPYVNLIGISFFTPILGPQFFDNIQVSPGVATTPVPAALPLLVTALAGLGAAGWRRKRVGA